MLNNSHGFLVKFSDGHLAGEPEFFRVLNKLTSARTKAIKFLPDAEIGKISSFRSCTKRLSTKTRVRYGI